MKKAIWLASLTVSVLLIVGCYSTHRRYGGGSFGSQVVPGSMLLNCLLFQRNVNQQPMFAIVWQAKKAGEAGTNGENLFVSIHKHKIAPDLTKKAVYALQTDYSLKEISLSEVEIDHLFSVNATQDTSFTKDEVWQAKVAPCLQLVESPD